MFLKPIIPMRLLKKLKNPVFAEEAAAASLPAENGDLQQQTKAENLTLYVTAMKATLGHSWIEVLWKATRISFLKVWQ